MKILLALIVLPLTLNTSQAATRTQNLLVRATVVKPCQIAWGIQANLGLAQPTEDCQIAVNPRDDGHNPLPRKPQSSSMVEDKGTYVIEHTINETIITF